MGKPRYPAPTPDDLTRMVQPNAVPSDQTGHFEATKPGRPEADLDQTCYLEKEGDTARPVVVVPPDETQSATPVLEGVVVPGYEILAELGRGGMGVVYKARHLRLQRLVALKMILAGAHAGATSLARFRAEAEAVARLHHPNIVQIYETGEHEGMPYFSLEFAEAGSLEQRIQERPLPPRAAAELVETLSRAMEVAHQQGIIHRDLKPANILLATARTQQSMIRKSTLSGKSHLSGSNLPADHWSRTTVPKIADFGLAKRLDDDSGNTQSGTILGTPSYMAPEQAEGKIRDIGPPTDVYSLGAILYELLVNRPPFKAGSPIDTIRQLLTQEPIAPRQLEPGVPHDLETICLKCLEKHPSRRYSSGSELADDLARFLDGEPIRARPTPAWEMAWKWGKRRPALMGLIAIALLAVLGIVLFIIWHNVTLRDQLAQARAEERQAREREQNALESQRLARLEAEGQKLLHDAKVAAAARDWASARLHLAQVLATIGTEPRLEKLKLPAQTSLAEAEEHLRSEADRQASRARILQFTKLRDEAFFLGCLYTGMDQTANLKATRAIARKALAVYGILVDRNDHNEVRAADLDDLLDEGSKTEILADCYQLLLILAETEAQFGQESEALRLVRLALQFGPPSRASHLRQARYLAKLGNKTEARREEHAASLVEVRTTLDHFLIGEELYRRARFAEASAAFEQTLQGKPGHFWAGYLNALCLLRLRRAAEARAQLSACLAQRTDFVWLYLLRGFAHGELQAFEAAEADFAAALKMPLDEFSRYVLLVNRGVQRVRQGKLDDAIADLKASIALRPNDYQGHVNLAQAYRQTRDLNGALQEMNRALQLEPSLPHLFRLRARLHLERKAPGLARGDLEQVLRRESPSSPFLADDHVEYGRLLLAERQYSQALKAFEAALQLRPDHLAGQRARGEALLYLGRFKEVVEVYDRYLEKGKPLESVYRGRGLARVELGQYPGAIEDYTRALELLPTAAVFTSRGWAHLVCEAPKLALRDFDLAIQLDATFSDAFAGRGYVYARQGRFREAIREAREALRLGPITPRLHFNAARIHAQCPGNGPTALELLGKALAALPDQQRSAFWTRSIQADAVFDPLRRMPEYLQLEAKYSVRK